jgi:hypothetical protein
MRIEDYLNATQHKITGGSEYCWDCFGPNARYLDCDKEQEYSTNIVFDTVTSEVYVCEMWDYVNDRQYRWLNKDYIKQFKKSCKEHDVDFHGAFDDSKFTDLEVEDDILEKITDIVRGVEYDTRVKVPIDFTDEELLKYMKLAHERDMTFNQLVEEALREAIDNYNEDPEGFRERMKAWAE